MPSTASATSAKPRRYECQFETRRGTLETVTITAIDRRDAVERLKAEYPNDVGADGTLYDLQTGDHLQLNWFA